MSQIHCSTMEYRRHQISPFSGCDLLAIGSCDLLPALKTPHKLSVPWPARHWRMYMRSMLHGHNQHYVVPIYTALGLYRPTPKHLHECSASQDSQPIGINAYRIYVLQRENVSLRYAVAFFFFVQTWEDRMRDVAAPSPFQRTFSVG